LLLQALSPLGCGACRSSRPGGLTCGGYRAQRLHPVTQYGSGLTHTNMEWVHGHTLVHCQSVAEIKMAGPVYNCVSC
jgi:hypothetical protein